MKVLASARCVDYNVEGKMASIVGETDSFTTKSGVPQMTQPIYMRANWHISFFFFFYLERPLGQLFEEFYSEWCSEKSGGVIHESSGV